MTPEDKIDSLIREVSELKTQIAELRLGIGRIASDYESEKMIRKDRHAAFDSILHGERSEPGLITRVDRLEQERVRETENRKHIVAIWIAVGIGIIKAAIEYIRK